MDMKKCYLEGVVLDMQNVISLREWERGGGGLDKKKCGIFGNRDGIVGYEKM